jgi:hypothetical protein
MASIWSLVEQHLQQQAGDLVCAPNLQRLLAAVEAGDDLAPDLASAVPLHPDPGPLQQVVWDVLRPLLALPELPAVPPLGSVPGDLTLKAYRLAGLGWEASLALPMLAFDLPTDLIAPGTLVQNGDQATVRREPGVVALAVPPVTLTVEAPNGTDPIVTAGSLAMTVSSQHVVLPFGFGLSLASLQIAPTGSTIPTPTIYLPAIPACPLPAIALPDLTIDPQAGLRLPLTEIPVPAPLAGVLSRITLAIDRPTARTFTKLVPTTVGLEIPLTGRALPLGGGSTTTATGTDLAIHLQFDATGSITQLTGAVVAKGGTGDGLASLDQSNVLALAAFLGPYLPNGPAGLAGLLGSAATADAIFPSSLDTRLVVHAATFAAALHPSDATVNDLTVTLDYDVALGVDTGALPLRVRTRAGAPVRMRHRQVQLVLDDPPRLSWDDAQSTIVSSGEWEIEGVPPEVIRIADVLFQRGSLAVELDLRSALDLDFVTVEQASLRVVRSDAGTVSVEFPGFGAAVDIPGTITGSGYLGYRDGVLDAALDLELPSIGVRGRGALAVAGDFVKLGVEVRLPVAIPFANSGLGLYSVGGLLAVNARRQLGPGDGITQELAWHPMQSGAVVPGDQVFMGFSAGIGTVPDFGFALMATGTVLIGLPDPLLRVTVAAELMRGMGGDMLGVIVVDNTALTIALRGDYKIPGLLEVSIPAGARFPYPPHLSSWEARLGGDGGSRGEPVTVTLLPELLGVKAWAFLMAFGDADTMIGAALKPPGTPAYGLSLAVGAGFEIDWSTGPFGFHAGAALLAVLTSRPKRASDTATPWVLAGDAEIHGAVDLGPVSIGAEAALKVMVDTGAGTFYGKAHACASIDCFFFEIEGCVEFDIGTNPPTDIPVPASPLLQLALTDRLGLQVATGTGDAAAAPTVWADAVPVLSFTHWVAVADPFTGLKKPVADFTPDDDGWMGTKKLQYRFTLTRVTVTEIDADGTETEIGSDWVSAWQLPIHRNVLGATRAPSEARTLALNTFDPHHWLKPATVAGEGTPGDPITFLHDLCLPLPPPGYIVFAGEDARLTPSAPVSIPTRTPGLASKDPTRLDVAVRSHYLGNEFFPLGPSVFSALLQAFWTDTTVLPISGAPLGLDHLGELQRFVHLPTASLVRGGARFTFDQPAVDLILYYLVPMEIEQQHVAVVTFDGDRWDIAPIGTIGDSGWALCAATAPAGVPVDAFVIASGYPIGFVGLVGRSAAAVSRYAANEASRQELHDTIEPQTERDEVGRRMLVPGRSYRVDVDLSWEGKGDGFTEVPIKPLGRQAFHFTVAPAQSIPRQSAAPVAAAAVAPWTALSTTSTAAERFNAATSYREIAATSLAHARRFDESILTTADLGRYVAGLVPASGTRDHFCDDLLQADFVVDYLPELAEAYGAQVVVAARRTRAPAADLAANLAPTIDLFRHDVLAVVAPPLLTHGLSALDVRRHTAAANPAGLENGCRVRYPGSGARSTAVLQPRSEYRLTVNVLPADVEAVAANLTPQSEIAAGWFHTSRYRTPTGQFAALGLRPGGTDLLPAIPVADPGGVIPATFAAVQALGLDGYPAAPDPAVHGLWIPGEDGTWLLAGVLLESPEPLDRPGRCVVTSITVGGVAATRMLWDDQRTRAAAIIIPQTADQPVPLAIHLSDTPPGAAAATHTLTAMLEPHAGLEGVWA